MAEWMSRKTSKILGPDCRCRKHARRQDGSHGKDLRYGQLFQEMRRAVLTPVITIKDIPGQLHTVINSHITHMGRGGVQTNPHRHLRQKSNSMSFRPPDGEHDSV